MNPENKITQDDIERLENIKNVAGEDAVLIGSEGIENKILSRAVIGIDHVTDRVVYSYNKLIQAFRILNPEWSEEDAVEWMEYNVYRSLPYAGERAPMIVVCEDEFSELS